MRLAITTVLLSAAVLTACNSASSRDEEAAVAAVSQRDNAAAAAAAAEAAAQATAVPGAPTGQALAGHIASTSLSGVAVSGETFCSYYAADGTMQRTIGGGAPSAGTWAVNGAALCSTVDGVTGCDQVDLLPTGQVTLTNLEGSGVFPVSATIAAGNQCG
jgi:hypothetical protein